MYKFLDLIFNFNTKKKINFERGIFWGFAIFFLTLVLLELLLRR